MVICFCKRGIKTGFAKKCVGRTLYSQLRGPRARVSAKRIVLSPFCPIHYSWNYPYNYFCEKFTLQTLHCVPCVKVCFEPCLDQTSSDGQRGVRLLRAVAAGSGAGGVLLYVVSLGVARERKPPLSAPQAEEAPATLGRACCRRLAWRDHLRALLYEGEAGAQLAILPLDMGEL